MKVSNIASRLASKLSLCGSGNTDTILSIIREGYNNLCLLEQFVGYKKEFKLEIQEGGIIASPTGYDLLLGVFQKDRTYQVPSASSKFHINNEITDRRFLFDKVEDLGYSPVFKQPCGKICVVSSSMEKEDIFVNIYGKNCNGNEVISSLESDEVSQDDEEYDDDDSWENLSVSCPKNSKNRKINSVAWSSGKSYVAGSYIEFCCDIEWSSIDRIEKSAYSVGTITVLELISEKGMSARKIASIPPNKLNCLNRYWGIPSLALRKGDFIDCLFRISKIEEELSMDDEIYLPDDYAFIKLCMSCHYFNSFDYNNYTVYRESAISDLKQDYKNRTTKSLNPPQILMYGNQYSKNKTLKGI